MTDTTDIAALREKYELALKDLTERLMECNRLNYCMDEITAFAAFSSTVIDQLEAERQRADKAELELIKPLPIGELIQRLEGQTYEKWFSQSDLKGDQVPVEYQIREINASGTRWSPWRKVSADYYEKMKPRYEVMNPGVECIQHRELFTAPKSLKLKSDHLTYRSGWLWILTSVTLQCAPYSVT